MSDGHLIKLRLSLMGRPVRNYTFEKPVISVGRDPGADVFVDNPGVSRDHFRLERIETGEYQVVDLGSANGTFVNDQMINSAIVHNNDVVRFGKYTLWVGYEQDRRAGPREGRTAMPPPVGAGQTVVLSRAEIVHILEKESRQSGRRGAVALSGPGEVARGARRPLWPILVVGFLVGAALAAAAAWWFLHR